MAYKKKIELKADDAISLGGINSKTGEKNPISVEGHYLGAKTTPDTGYGEGKLHIFSTARGTVGVWGKSHLNRLLTSDHVGQMCLVTFTGMSIPKKGKRPAYQYELQYDAENTIDVSGITVETSDEEPEDTVDSDDYNEAPSVTLSQVTSRPNGAVPSNSKLSEIQAKLRKASTVV